MIYGQWAATSIDQGALGAAIAAAAQNAATRAGAEQQCRGCASRNPGAYIKCGCVEACDSEHCSVGIRAQRDMPGCAREVYGFPIFEF